jgi:hypothetical protein
MIRFSFLLWLYAVYVMLYKICIYFFIIYYYNSERKDTRYGHKQSFKGEKNKE